MISPDPGRRGRRARMLGGWGVVAAYLAVITLLSHQPSLPVPGGLPDWVAHGAEFGVLAALLIRALRLSGRRPAPVLGALVVAACALAGALDEFHQSFVPGRDATLRDVVADTTGAAIVTGGALLWGSLRRRRGDARGTRGRVEVRLLGRRDCHLCDEAETVLSRVLPEFDARLLVIDIDEDPELSRLYGNEVPVVLLDGKKAFKYRVDPGRLRRKLASCEQRRMT